MSSARNITVSCLRSDPAGFGIPKYDNRENWNTPGGRAPNGVSATRWLRRTAPDAALLSPLAAWLVANLPLCVAGTMPTRSGNLRIEGRETEADAVRRRYGSLAANIIRCYAIPEDRPTIIDSWLFPQIATNEDDTAYWNRVAAEIIAAGGGRLSVDGHGPVFVVE